MQPLQHSYTNDTRGDGRIVVKRYEGPDAAVRRSRERATLARLQGRLTVPVVLGGAGSDELRMPFVERVHGQELISCCTLMPPSARRPSRGEAGKPWLRAEPSVAGQVVNGARDCRCRVVGIGRPRS